MDILNSFLQLIGTLIVAIGGPAVIIIPVAAWVSKVWADRIHERTVAKHSSELEALRTKYDRELEMLKASITERQKSLDVIYEALFLSHGASHEKVLMALEALWKASLDILEKVRLYLYLYTVFLPDEFESISETDLAKPILDANEDEPMESILLMMREAEPHRIFVGERLWQLFDLYAIFCTRIAFKVNRKMHTDGVFPKWDEDLEGKKDTGFLQMLQLEFAEEELDTLINMAPIGIPGRILSSLQVKMVDEMNRLTFGRKLVEQSLEERLRFSEFDTDSVIHGGQSQV